MTEHAVNSAHRLVAGRVGLRIDPGIRSRLQRCLTEAAAAHGMAGDLDGYAARLVYQEDLFQDLLNRITVQETAFFRDPGQFVALAERILPNLTDPITFWSAGCATGQEPYSLAIVLAEAGRKGYSVLATDISTKALAIADAGIFTGVETRGLSPERLERHFTPIAPDRFGKPRYQVKPELRRAVKFQRHNLVGEAPPFARGESAVIFCRNVLIYMTRLDLLAILRRFRDWLPLSGYLFLGYSESLWQASDDFRLIRVGEAFAYQVNEVGTPTLPGLIGSPSGVPAPLQTDAPVRARAPAPVDKLKPKQKHKAQVEVPSVAELLAEGEASLAAGDTDSAVTNFRKAVYLDGDHPLAHFYLGLCLEAAGDARAARRAFTAARAAVGRCDGVVVQAALEGYGIDDLSTAIAFKLGRTP